MITANGVTVGYNGHLALSEAGLVARSGETLGLIGPNGSGKSTLLRAISGAVRPDHGTATIDSDPVTALRGRNLASKIAVVTQESVHDLHVTVADMVLLGRTPWVGALAGYSRQDRTLAATALTRVGARHLAGRDFATLSGGERQRVLIARALAQQADHLLLDEPTNHLDVRYQHELLTLVRSLEITTIVVLHDLNLAARYCDRLVLLDRGRVAATGTPGDVLTPAILEPVYQVHVEVFSAFGSTQLLFGPRASAGTAVSAR